MEKPIGAKEYAEKKMSNVMSLMFFELSISYFSWHPNFLPPSGELHRTLSLSSNFDSLKTSCFILSVSS